MSFKLEICYSMHEFGMAQLQGSNTLTCASGVLHQQAHLTGTPVTSVRICAASGHERRSRTTGIVLPAYLPRSANTTGAPQWVRQTHTACTCNTQLCSTQGHLLNLWRQLQGQPQNHLMQ